MIERIHIKKGYVKILNILFYIELDFGGRKHT